VGWHIRVTNLLCVQGLRNLHLRSQFSIFDSFRDIRVHIYYFLKFVGVKVGVANLFLGQSIGIEIGIETVGATVLGGLWALVWS